MKIGLLIIATNKYTSFLQQLISSADDFFCKNHEVTYFVFSDKNVNINSSRTVKHIHTDHKQWPFMTLYRYKIFNQSKDELCKMDYLFYCDVDMRFVGNVYDVILSERVATQHPGYAGTRGTPETNIKSLACVYDYEEMQYFAGGFNGGSSSEYLKMCKKLAYNIDEDYKNGIIAIWHDESHMNRYFIDNKPTTILSPSYCYGESMSIPYEKKILALDKNHDQIRN